MQDICNQANTAGTAQYILQLQGAIWKSSTSFVHLMPV